METHYIVAVKLSPGESAWKSFFVVIIVLLSIYKWRTNVRKQEERRTERA